MNPMSADHLTPEFNDKRIHVVFIDGVHEDILVNLVSNSHCHDECDGIVYKILWSNRPGWTKTDDCFWAEMRFIENFAPMEDTQS